MNQPTSLLPSIYEIHSSSGPAATSPEHRIRMLPRHGIIWSSGAAMADTSQGALCSLPSILSRARPRQTTSSMAPPSPHLDPADPNAKSLPSRSSCRVASPPLPVIAPPATCSTLLGIEQVQSPASSA
ncbi:uncharacterized protein LOC119315071 [Triticum dicoccoides]|uniref:uncharacterized protein LOC119315071 n=1 Tax=Triticum dicoccoides TaxID=85692 RepID=UPI001890CB7F|nr:uncharacterized protein LOC119315071 [Triticum dicoccoides]